MRVSNPDATAPPAAQRSDTFTGMVWGQPLLGDLPDMAANAVLFAPGARTYWHRHERGQILHVTDGVGKVRPRGGEEATVRVGDTIWVPPGEEHYHGADSDHFFIHLAFSFGTTEWLGEVTDEEYGAGSA